MLAEFVRGGFDVLTPFGGGQPYDLAVHIAGTRFLRVQCKTAWPVARGCMAFNCRSTDHGRGRIPYDGLADLFGIHLPTRDAIYLVPIAAAPGHMGRLRLEPTKNNQRRGVRFAADFEFERWTEEKLRALSA